MPVFPANVAAIWTPANIQNDSQNAAPYGQKDYDCVTKDYLHKSDDGNHLDDGEEKFRFTVGSNSAEIYGDYQNQKDCNPCSWGNWRVPVLYRDCRSNNLKR